jgi:hypothetical protein
MPVDDDSGLTQAERFADVGFFLRDAKPYGLRHVRQSYADPVQMAAGEEIALQVGPPGKRAG